MPGFVVKFPMCLICGMLLLVLCGEYCSASDECTVGIIAGSVTEDGRPLLFKSRDVSNEEQEFVYDNSGSYAYISVTYAGVTDQAWGGVNETGFAVMNANAWNFSDLVPGPDDDGYIMRDALQSCATIEDFQVIMTVTDSGRTRPAIYGVIDANGDGALFEAASYEHFRFDLDDPIAAPNGYMIRANFGYEGGPNHVGQHRHDRALVLMDSAYAGGFISQRYIFQVILRDLVNEDTDPYPLPFQGRERGMPYGVVHTHDSINRDITKSAYVVQGIQLGEDPLLSTLWAMAGEPIATIALPLWVHAGSAPPEFDGPDYAPLNLKALQFRGYLYQRDLASDAMDTWRLIDEHGEGLAPFLTLLEDQAASVGDSALNVWRTQGLPEPSVIESLQNDIASWALSEMDLWGPPQSPTAEIVWQTIDQVQLNWTTITLDVFGRPTTVSGYTIYASDQPFIDRLLGDSLTTVNEPPATLPATEANRFFQVRCQP